MRLIFSLSSESGFDNLEKTQETRGGFYICQKDFLSIIKEEIESITKKIKPNPSENKNVLLKVLKKKHPKLFTKNIFPLNYDVISLILISGIFTLKNLLSVKDNSKDKNLKSPFFNENEI